MDYLLARVEEEYDNDYTRVDIGRFEAVTMPLDQVDEYLGEFRPSYVVMDQLGGGGLHPEELGTAA